ncbi:EF-hand calcium-binding domain-containing protein 5, partial [Dryobates pubescens]
SYRLARMKAEVKSKREAREQLAAMKSKVKEMRKEALAIQFKEWTVDVSDRIPVALDMQIPHHLPSKPISLHFSLAISDRKLEFVDTLEKTVSIDEFTEYVHSFTEHFSNDMFQEILKHLHQCADDFQEAVRQDMWRQMFAELFLVCDYGKVGLLNRQKILALLKDFHDRSPVAAKRGFCNPSQWPIIELQDMELADLWGGLDQEVCVELSEKSVLSQTGISEGEILPCEPADDDRQGTHTMRTSASEDLFEQMDVSERAETGGIPKEEHQAPESTGAELREEELVKETPARKESFSRQHSSQVGQQTSSETRPQDEDVLQDRVISEYTTPQTLISSQHSVSCQGFRACSSHRMAVSCLAQRQLLLEALFEKWDNNASGFLDLEEVDAVLNTFKEGMEKEAVRKGQLLPIPVIINQSIFSYTVPYSPLYVLITKFSLLNSKVTLLPVYLCLLSLLFSRNLTNYFLPFSLLLRVQQDLKSGCRKNEKMMKVLVMAGLMRDTARSMIRQAQAGHSTQRIFLSNRLSLSYFLFLLLAKNQLCTRYPQLSRVGKLSPKAFQSFLELVASEFTGDEDEAIDNLVEFLTTSVERSDMECLKSFERRKWLYNIQQAAETSGASMEPVYKAVFKALSQDAEAHGDNKKISSYIALLEENQRSPERGQILLHYVACTADDAPYVLNQILYKDMKGVSFAAVEEGKPIHVPNVQLHGNMHFWNYDRPPEDRKGSFLVLPLQDAHWRAFGILGLDTLRDQHEETVIMAHEISFYQGVSRAFSKAYLHICILENVLQIAVTALEWLYPRAPSIHTVSMYLVEPGKDKPWDYALRKMVTTHNTGQKEIHSSPALLLRKENLLRNYLFKCTDSSEVTCISLWGKHHIAVPLRDLSGQAFGIFDISIGQHQKLPPHQQKDLQKMLKMAQAACWEILKKSTEETEPACVLEAERLARLKNAGILFHRFMLQDLRECIRNLDADSFAKIKSQGEPPALVHNIVKAVLLLFHPDWKGSEETENWSQCKLKLDDNLIQEIYCFDPTATSVHIQVELLLDCITGVPVAAVQQHSCIPAQHLYHWLHTCLSLAEIARSLHS